MLVALQKGGVKLEALDMLKSIASSLSYLIIVSRFIIDGFDVCNNDRGNNRIKSRKWVCLTYFIIIFAIDLIFTANEWEVHANYIFLAVTTVFIGRSTFVNSFTERFKDKAYGYIQGFGYALTILVAFQWIIAFTGGITFVLLPQEGIGDSFGFVTALSLTHIAAALLIRK